MISTSPILDLLIVGSGPVGLTAAVEARRLGLSARIIERKVERSSHDSRALVVHPRVLELLQPLGDGSVVANIESSSTPNQKVNLHFGLNDVLQRRIDGPSTNMGDTEFPFISFLPQYETERILEEELQRTGGAVDYGVSLIDLVQSDDAKVVTTTIRHANGQDEKVASKYVLGCDGGRSKTRELIGVDLHRSHSSAYYIVGDLKFTVSSLSEEKELHVFPHKQGLGMFFSLPEKNAYRIMFQAPVGVTSKKDVAFDKAFFEDLLLERTGMKFEVELGAWQSIFEVTHGICPTYRKGRVFLAGDASHVHSPVGGQGKVALVCAESCRPQERCANPLVSLLSGRYELRYTRRTQPALEACLGEAMRRERGSRRLYRFHFGQLQR